MIAEFSRKAEVNAVGVLKSMRMSSDVDVYVSSNLFTMGYSNPYEMYKIM